MQQFVNINNTLINRNLIAGVEGVSSGQSGKVKLYLTPQSSFLTGLEGIVYAPAKDPEGVATLTLAGDLAKSFREQWKQALTMSAGQ